MSRARELECTHFHLRASADRQHCKVQRRRPGWGPRECGKVATHEIDGLFLCQTHAGARALEILVAEPQAVP